MAIGMLATACRAAIDPAAISDAQTAARVKTALVNDPDLGVYAIEVSVRRGVARLSGRVQTPALAERAASLARKTQGVTDVELALQMGSVTPATVPPEPVPRALVEGEPFEPQATPTLLAVGGSIGWSVPRAAALRSRISVGPLVKLGSGQGAGLAIGFDWFKADVDTGGNAALARVHVRPIMLGLAYTFRSERASIAPSVVGGYAFNSVSVAESGTTPGGLVVDIDNSLVWRPGVSIWIDAGSRVALNVAAGYLVTSLDLTVFEDGRLSKRRTRGDTAVLHAGLAYKLF
jgi:hypothetical protein